MQNYASVFRTGDIMKEGCEKMADIYGEMEDLKVGLFSILLFLFLKLLIVKRRLCNLVCCISKR